MAAREVAIIGAGVVGSAFGHLLRRKGYEIKGVYCRTRKAVRVASDFIGQRINDGDMAHTASSADLVFLTVPDRVIAPVCHEIASKKGFREGATVIHASGALPSTVLNEAHCCGAFVGSIHPLMSFANPQEAVERFPGIFCSYESDPEVNPMLKDVVQALGGIPLSVPACDKALYHAAASTASNFVVTLLAVAREILSVANFGHENVSLESLLPLVKSAVSNVEAVGIPEALTGPISRGDVDVVKAHVDAISEQAPRYLDVYRELGKLTISLGLEKGSLDPSAGQEIFKVLEAQTVEAPQ